LVATLAFVAVEVVAGTRAHSLALLSDAGHNFTDALALLLAWFGVYFQSKPADEVKTYGYHRAGVLAAFVNALALVALSVWIIWESVERLRNPAPVSEIVMMAVAALGLVVNGGVMLALRATSRDDLNVRSAFIHMLGDALGSIAIVLGALAMRYTGWRRIDPGLSILIALLIVWTAWGIVREALNILLEGLPRGLSLAGVIEAIREVDGVLEVHDLHIWSLGSSTRALSCHVTIADIPASESDVVLRRLHHVLAEQFHIFHSTVQFEHATCAISENGCAIPVSRDERDEHNIPGSHEEPAG
jgi:cobalt-zinc-cadmium efflux system protein